ncbi:hypothetical protein NLX69_11315 [Rossellomorea sp. BNER]|nr:hypothetical protein [Rossellomorea sp. BNER]
MDFLEFIPDFPYGKVRNHLAEQYLISLPDDVQETIYKMKNYISLNNIPFQNLPLLLQKYLWQHRKNGKSRLPIKANIRLLTLLFSQLEFISKREFGICQL